MQEKRKVYPPMEIKVTLCAEDQKKPIPTDYDNLGFGRHFSDHMFMMNYNPDDGWHDARIAPFGPITLSPAAMVLHYGQEVFEGLKAYYGADDRDQAKGKVNKETTT